MSNTTDSRQADVERAVKAAAQRLLSREIGISEAVAAVAVVLEGPKEANGNATRMRRSRQPVLPRKDRR